MDLASWSEDGFTGSRFGPFTIHKETHRAFSVLAAGTLTDPSAVNDGGAVQAPLSMGATASFADTQPPIEDEGYVEQSVLEDPTEAPED